VRWGANVRVIAADLAAADFDAKAFVQRCAAELGYVSHLFLAVGATDTADDGLPSADVVEALALVNYVRPAQLLSAACEYFSGRGEGHAMVFTSIAADAPRGKNAAYGSAKKGLVTYCRSLQHNFADSRISIQICSLGYVDTSMTFGAKLLFPVASPAAAARFALGMCETHTRFSYFPRFWSPVIMLLKALPWFLYKRLRF
jgi:NAD(P)-dependent dehydrogenase (short-subunit alcohol dehydrogenase family)